MGSGNGLVPTRQQAIIWSNDGQVYRGIYASLGLNELIQKAWWCMKALVHHFIITSGNVCGLFHVNLLLELTLTQCQPDAQEQNMTEIQISKLKSHVMLVSHSGLKILTCVMCTNICYLTSSRTNGCYFTDDIFKSIFLNENIRTLIQIPLKFVPWGPIDNKSALVQVMVVTHRRQAITWINADPVHSRIYAALGGDELFFLLHWMLSSYHSYIAHILIDVYQMSISVLCIWVQTWCLVAAAIPNYCLD